MLYVLVFHVLRSNVLLFQIIMFNFFSVLYPMFSVVILYGLISMFQCSMFNFLCSNNLHSLLQSVILYKQRVVLFEESCSGLPIFEKYGLFFQVQMEPSIILYRVSAFFATKQLQSFIISRLLYLFKRTSCIHTIFYGLYRKGNF